MKVMKFGGTSVRDAAQIQKSVAIILEEYGKGKPLAVVVSAIAGATTALIEISKEAATGSSGYLDPLKKLENVHVEIASALQAKESLLIVEEGFKELGRLLHGVNLIGELSPKTLDLIMSFGERLSAAMIKETIQKEVQEALFVDAREWIVTNSRHKAALVNFEKTNLAITTFFKNNSKSLPIITGFIAATQEGVTTTLGRGGSDFTAAIVAAAVNAEMIEIWTDVDGVMTADPRKVKQAFPIPVMSYDEMMELSHFGAKVLHPPTLNPAMQKKIPITIKNSFNKEAVGTLIQERGEVTQGAICGISSIDHVALLRLEGSGMVGVSGVATRLFNALAKKEINVIIITQCSSEHSICFAVAPEESLDAKASIEEAFALEISAKLVNKVIVEKDVSIIAIVGENMCRTPGISGLFFGALGKNGVNVIAIAQGSSELNITCVIAKSDEKKALNVIHDAFFLSDTTTLNLFLVGKGLIGNHLLKEIDRQRQRLHDHYNLKLEVVATANSAKMQFEEGHDEPMELHSYIEKMKKLNLANSIFVDCTSSDAVAECYPAILSSNIAIVTPNKKANSGPYSRYLALKELSRKKGARFLYETNVGAALPILGTLNDLILSGDTIHKIEGVLSGTLSYLFNNFSENVAFAEIVRKAHISGFTEPDPRDDLNGMDVARKLLILARECGYPLELSDIAMEPLLPKAAFAPSSVEEFLEALPELSESLSEKRALAEVEGKKLCYIATLEGGKAHIALQAIGKEHPFYSLSGSDNIVAITTDRYKTSPLVIKGAGAGADVTAGEVLAGIIKAGKETPLLGGIISRGK